MSILHPNENPWRCTKREQDLIVIVLPDFFSEDSSPIFCIETKILSSDGMPEYRACQRFSYFENSIGPAYKWVKPLEQKDCPFFYLEEKGAIYDSLEDAINGLPKNFLTYVD